MSIIKRVFFFFFYTDIEACCIRHSDSPGEKNEETENKIKNKKYQNPDVLIKSVVTVVF
jgi:hypothetical protein